MTKNNFHSEILYEIQKLSGFKKPTKEGFGLKYVGTDKSSYHLDTKGIREIAKNFVKIHQFDLSQYIDLLNSLYAGETCDEIYIAAKIIEFSPQLKLEFDLKHLDNWLNYVHGWAEVDTLCQMAFTDVELLSRWNEWKKIIIKFSTDPNVHKRRASLVLLTKPSRLSPDKKISDLAFKNIDLLKSEKDILVTKAISWSLRQLTKFHSEQVANYLEKNKDTLPKIAVRETTMKLLTGRKYINGSKKL